MKPLAALIILAIATASHATGKPDFPNGHDNRPEKQAKPVKTTAQSVKVKQSARAEASAQAMASARSSGSATATAGQVIVSNGGAGNGLSGRMVPDVSSTSPITSTSCRNGITAGGSGNGWGGLLGFFSEDDLCEWRLLEANYRATGDADKANAIRSGMTAQRCKKLAPEDREMFGDLCPKQPAQDGQNVAFSSAG